MELKGVLGTVEGAELLADGRKLETEQEGQVVKVRIPADVEPDCGMTVVRLRFADGFRTVPDNVLRTFELTAKNAIPVYAYSSMDYYSSFQSVVGYVWHFEKEGQSVVPTVVYTAGNEGDEVCVEIDGEMQRVVLRGGKAVPLSVKPGDVKWEETRLFGPREECFDGESIKDLGAGQKMSGFKMGESLTIPVGEKEAVYVEHTLTSDRVRDILVSFGVADGFRVLLNGETVAMRTYVGGLERKPEVLKLHLRKGENKLLVELYNRYGKSVDYVIDPSIPQEMYALPLNPMKLYPGTIHDCRFGLAHPVNKNSDMGMRDVRIELK